MLKMLRSIINSQVWLSRKLDCLFPEKFTIDGNLDFLTRIAPSFLRKDIVVYDIGGGKNPYISVLKKEELSIQVVGLDISGDELLRAPAGAYDKTVCADITSYIGSGDADVVLCQALLEHVPDVSKAIQSISSIVKKGGDVVIFVPSRNAVFARLNLILPQRIKEALLYYIFPSAKHNQGFPSFYDKCTLKQFRKMAEQHNFDVVEEHCYFVSSYFSFFFPLYLFWRVWIFIFYFFSGDNAAETFSVVLRKK